MKFFLYIKAFCTASLLSGLFLANIYPAQAEDFNSAARNDIKKNYENGTWMDATGYFHEMTQKIVEEHGTPQQNITRIRKTPDIKTEGQKEIFNVMNIEKNKPEKRTAILKKIGKHCHLYLEEGKEYDDKILSGIVERFDDVIYKNNTETFGCEPNPGIDNDERIAMLIVDIKDGWAPGKGFVGGYFFPLDCYPVSVVQYSNEREMIYLDCYPSNPADPLYPGIIAHEFQHMIHFANDAKEDKWLNEGCSQLAHYICGFGHPPQILSFMKNPSDDVTVWQNSMEDYGAVYLFHYYLFHKYAGSNLSEKQKFYRALVASPLKDIESIDAALAQYGLNKTFEDIYKDWLVANLINKSEIAGGLYGYDESLKLRVNTTYNFTALPVEIKKVNLLNHGAANILFTPFVTHLPQTPAVIEKFIVYSEKPAVMAWGINGWRRPADKFLPPDSIITDGLAETKMNGPDEKGFYYAEIGPLTGAEAAETFNYKLKFEDGSISDERLIDIIGPDASKAGAGRKRVAENNILVVNFKGAKPTPADKNKLFRLIQIIEDTDGKISVGEVPLKNNQAKIAVPSYSNSIKKVYFIAYQLNNKKLAFSLDAKLVFNMNEAGKAYIMKIE